MLSEDLQPGGCPAGSRVVGRWLWMVGRFTSLLHPLLHSAPRTEQCVTQQWQSCSPWDGEGHCQPGSITVGKQNLEEEGNRILFPLTTRAMQKGWRRQRSRPCVSEWLSGEQEEAISSWVFCGTLDSCLPALLQGKLCLRHGRARRKAAQYQPGMETVLTRCSGTRRWKPVDARRRKRLKKADSASCISWDHKAASFLGECQVPWLGVLEQ